MGVVFLAQHQALKRPTALKLIRASIASVSQVTRFRSEAEAIARLNDPHIVQIFEVGECPAGPFVALEYVSGGSLDRRLKQNLLEASESADLTEQIARAIQKAHEAGIIHRDLKPANILLTEQGTGKVTDFGLAKFTDHSVPELTHEGAVMGTPSYMAPEQAAGRLQEIGPRTDVYALGAILYECLTGRPPLRGANTRETLDLVCNAEPLPLRAIRPSIPRDLETIAHKCLQKSPSRRYGSAAELANDLQRFRKGRAILARPVGRLEKTIKWCRRNPSLAALICVCIVVALVGVVAGYWVNQQLKADRDNARFQEGVAQKALQDLQESSLAERKAAENALLQQRTALYGRNISDAHRWLLNHRTDEGKIFLDACDMDLRGWEWNLLRRFESQSPLILPGTFRSVAIHPSGDRFVLGKEDGSLERYDRQQLRKPDRFPLHQHSVVRCLYDPTGMYLASVSVKGELVLFEERTGKVLFKRTSTNSFSQHLAFSPKGHRLIHGSDKKQLDVMSIPDGKVLIQPKLHDSLIAGVGFLNNGDWAFSCSFSGEVKVWEVASGKEVIKLNTNGIFGPILAGTANSSANKIAVCDLLRQLSVYDGTSGKMLWRKKLEGTNWVETFQFSADGRSLFGDRKDSGIVVWDAASGRELMHLREPSSFFTDDFAVSPDGKHVIHSGSSGAKVWRLNHPLESWTWTEGSNQILTEPAFSADGTELVYRTGAGRFVRLETATGKVLSDLQFPDQHGYPWAFSPGATHYVIAGDQMPLRCYDGAKGNLLWTLPAISPGSVQHIRFRNDGQWIAAGTSSGEVFLIDAVAGKEIHRFSGSSRSVDSLSFSPDGKWLAATWKKGIIVWDTTTMESVHEAALGDGRNAIPRFSPAGDQLAVGCADGRVRIFDASDWSEVRVLPPQRNSICFLSYSPDGSRLLSMADKVIRFWDARTGQEVFSLEGNYLFTNGFHFSPDGRWLAIADRQTLRVYDGGKIVSDAKR